MSQSDRREQYKKGVSTIEQLREKARQHVEDIRRDHRSKIMSLKRVRLEPLAGTSDGSDGNQDGPSFATMDSSSHADGSPAHAASTSAESTAESSKGETLFNSEYDMQRAEQFLQSGGNPTPSPSLSASLLGPSGSSASQQRAQRLVRELLREVQSQKSTRRTEALRQIRRLLSHKGEAVDVFVSNSDGIDTLIDLLTGTNSDDQLEAAWCFCNLSAGSLAHTAAASKAAPHLIAFLSGSNPVMQDQAAWALANIAAESVQYRDLVTAQGAISPLVRLLQSSADASVVKSVAFALGNLARGQGADRTSMLKAGVLSAAVKQMEMCVGNQELKPFVEIAWVLTYLTTSANVCHTLAAMNALPLLSQGLYAVLSEALNYGAVRDSSILGRSRPRHTSLVDTTPIVRVLANFASVPDDNLTSAILASHPEWLQIITVLLSCQQSHILAETAWLVGNITASNDIQKTAALVSAGVIPLLVPLLYKSKHVALEAATAICNICDHSYEYLGAFLTHGALDGFTHALDAADLQLVKLALQFLDMVCRCDALQGQLIVQNSNAPSILEKLRYHANSAISMLAGNLCDQFLESDHEEDREEDRLDSDAMKM